MKAEKSSYFKLALVFAFFLVGAGIAITLLSDVGNVLSKNLGF